MMMEEEFEVCPTEDMFMALLNTLLRPYLSRSPHPPLLANQVPFPFLSLYFLISYSYYYYDSCPSFSPQFFIKFPKSINFYV